MSPSRLPAFFISHGGGPWPYVEAMRPLFAVSERELRALPRSLAAPPTAILMVSAHWEAAEFSVATAARPPVEYDYTGFPEHTYRIRYPAPGAPWLAAEAARRLGAAGIATHEDAARGFDHGAFVPLGLMYPEADVPVAMLSIKSSLDPAEHLAAGRALEPLRSEGVLIVGSGLTYHNMRGFGRDASTPVASRFEAYLNEAITQDDPDRRDAMLVHWRDAPDARLAHPREDHLIPLMVVAGAAGRDRGERVFVDQAMSVAMASYRFGASAAP